jgi:hypothetical protein
MTIHAVGRDQLTRRARSNESEALCVRHQVPEELNEAFSGQVCGGLLPQEKITMSPKIAIPVIAVALALAFSAHACDNCNRGNASTYQSAQYCMPQYDELSDMMRIYC